MSKANHRSGYRAAQRYRRAAFGLIAFGVVAGLIGDAVGFGTVGLVVYVLAALTGVGLFAYVRVNDSLSMGDEMLCELERRASHYAVILTGGVGWVALMGVALLNATGRREMTATEGTLFLAFGAFWAVWVAIYVVLRLRR